VEFSTSTLPNPMGEMMENNQVLQFEVVKRLTVPFLVIPNDGSPYYLKFDTAIEPDKTTFSERVRKSKTDSDPNAKPMHIATVTNIQTG
jgi:hypothetical protein